MAIPNDVKWDLAEYMNTHQDDSFSSIAAVFELNADEVAEFAVEWAMGMWDKRRRE